MSECKFTFNCVIFLSHSSCLNNYIGSPRIVKKHFYDPSKNVTRLYGYKTKNNRSYYCLSLHGKNVHEDLVEKLERDDIPRSKPMRFFHYFEHNEV